MTSPGERLAECRVKPDTTRVLIGDSVFVPLRPDLMYPDSKCENISVSGLRVHEVTHLLANIPQSPNVRQAVFHVGINTCGLSETSVPESEWTSLLKLAKKAFPSAAIEVSSVILPKSGDPALRKWAFDSNAALEKCCQNLDCIYINNDIIFRTENGAPRKALYRDNIHPSFAGTKRLAFHIKCGGKPPVPCTQPPGPGDYDRDSIPPASWSQRPAARMTNSSPADRRHTAEAPSQHHYPPQSHPHPNPPHFNPHLHPAHPNPRHATRRQPHPPPYLNAVKRSDAGAERGYLSYAEATVGHRDTRPTGALHRPPSFAAETPYLTTMKHHDTRPKGTARVPPSYTAESSYLTTIGHRDRDFYPMDSEFVPWPRAAYTESAYPRYGPHHYPPRNFPSQSYSGWAGPNPRPMGCYLYPSDSINGTQV